MRRRVEANGIPFELLNGIQAHHTGLRACELQQLQGPKSYVTVPGEQYDFETTGGNAPGRDDKPTDAPLEIATTLYKSAFEHRATQGGDCRFRVKLFVITKNDEAEPFEIKFSVSDDDLADESPNGIDARTRSGFITEIVNYVRMLHAENIAFAGELRGIGASVAAVVKAPADLLGPIINLRMDAIEDRAEALLEGLGDDPHNRRQRFSAAAATTKSPQEDQWKQARETIKETLNGPVGLAAAAKLLGLSPQQARELLSGKLPADVDENDIRSVLKKLGGSLESTQQTKLAEKLGLETAARLKTAATESEEKCRATLEAFFDEVDKAGTWSVFDEVLTKEQATLVQQLMELVTKKPEAKK